MSYRVMLCIAAVLVVTLTAGCATSIRSAPGALPLGAPSTKATYDILGDTEGTSSGILLFGIFKITGESKVGTISGGGPVILPCPIEAAAVYNAIEAKEGADALIAPRWKMEETNYILWKDKTATCKGKAIRYNPSAQ